MSQEFSEQELIRREKLQQLVQAGIEPYPAETYPVNTLVQAIRDGYSEVQAAAFSQVTLAGRIMGFRDMGKASFATLQDSSGRIQLYVRQDDICPGEDKTLYQTIWKKLLDIGDIIGVEGFVFITRSGELSLHVRQLKLLAKSLKPLPVVKQKEGEFFDQVTDPEFKYRQRYADLIINPQDRDLFIRISRIKQTIREFLNQRGALEVDTPVLQSIPGGAAARPFITHHHALDIPLYLRIADELYLKRLIVGGYDWVYEFSRNFRNEGMDRTHNPEFTVLEFYVAFKDYNWMMETTESLMETLATSLHGSTRFQSGDLELDFKPPYPRVPMFEAIQKFTGLDISLRDEEELRQLCREWNLPVEGNMGKGKLIDEIFSTRCEPHFIQPTFITDYPLEMSPLTKKHRSKPGLVERFELMVNGKEIANAYSELNDPIDQRIRFTEQLRLMERGDEEAMFIDRDFLRALEYGMPPTAGIGIGMDRLCMLMTGQPAIQDVLFFPQLRPEQGFE